MLTALLLAGAAPDPRALDRAIAADRAQLAAIDRPLLRAIAAAAGDDPAAGDAQAIARAWLGLAAPVLRARRAALTRDLARLGEARADMMLAPLLAGVSARHLRTATIAVPTCGSAAYRLPDMPALRPRAAAALGRVQGLTLVARAADPVRAPAAGRISYAGRFRHYDGIVVIDHGGGWTSLVTGLGRLAVTANQPVVAGALLGRTGAGVPLVGVDLMHHGVAVDPRRMAARCVG